MYLTLLGTLFCAMVDPLCGAGKYLKGRDQPPRALGVPMLARFIDEIIRRISYDSSRSSLFFSHVELGGSFSGSAFLPSFPMEPTGFR